MCFRALILNSYQILSHWGELEGKTRILGKCENWGIFMLQMGDRILMKLDILKDLMSQMLQFSTLIGSVDMGVGGGKHKSWKTLRVER